MNQERIDSNPAYGFCEILNFYFFGICTAECIQFLVYELNPGIRVDIGDGSYLHAMGAFHFFWDDFKTILRSSPFGFFSFPLAEPWV